MTGPSLAPGYPVVLDLAGRVVVVVGGGAVGTRRAAGLVAAGAVVTVVAPEVTATLADLADRAVVTLRTRAWLPQDLDGAVLVVAATGVPAVDRAVAAAARERRVLCNVAGKPGLGDLAVPAVARRGDLLLAVSTSGRVPGLAGAIRRRLERAFGPEWAMLVGLLAGARTRLPRASDTGAWEDVLDDPRLATALQRGDNDEAREQLERILTSRQSRSGRDSVRASVDGRTSRSKVSLDAGIRPRPEPPHGPAGAAGAALDRP